MIVDIEFDKAASVREAISVEFTEQSVRIMQLEGKDPKISLRAFAEVPLNPGDVKNGIIQNPTVVGNKLMEALRTAAPKRATTQYAICLIPQRYTFLTVLDLPGVDKEELREILDRRVSEIIPMDELDVYWDWHRIQNVGNKTRVQLAAVPRELIDSYMQTLEGAKLIPLLFEPSSTAASRVAYPFDSAQLQNKVTEPIILLEMQQDYGVISLMQQGGIVFSTDISLKSESMAEKVIVLEQKISEISKYAQTHLNVKPATEIIKTLVFGLKAQIDKILPLIKERTEQPIGLISPRYESSQVVEFFKTHSATSYHALVGAATRGLKDYGDQATLNLIPKKAKEAFRKKEMYNVLRDYLMFVAINTVFLVFMLLLVAMQIRARVDDLQNQYQSILAITNSPIVNEVEQSVDLLNARTSELNGLVEGIYDWSILLDMVNTTTPGSITLTSVVATPLLDSGSGVINRWEVRIAGESGDRQNVIQYLNNLRGSELLQKVKLPIESLQSQTGSNFVLEAELPFENLLQQNG